MVLGKNWLHASITINYYISITIATSTEHILLYLDRKNPGDRIISIIVKPVEIGLSLLLV